MSSIPTDFQNALLGNYDGFSARFRTLTVEHGFKSVSASTHVYYPSLQGSTPNIDAFIDFIYWRIIPFCIPRSVISRADERYERTKDHRYRMELHDKARDLFVKSLGQRTTTGEPAELLLYILMEAVLEAPQIACKMFLKTSQNVHVHGSDSIHATHSSSGDGLRLIWGESKLKKDGAGAIRAACESISAFNTSQNGRAPRDRDLEVIRDHINVPDRQLREAVLEYFDPYSDRENRREEAYACLICFDLESYREVAELPPGEAEVHLQERIAERSRSLFSLLEKHTVDHGIGSSDFYFFLLPFDSVETLRHAFLGRLES